MRLTKRQLKRIIREEYSRLKRKGLLRETMGADSSLEIPQARFADAVDSVINDGGYQSEGFHTIGYAFEEMFETIEEYEDTRPELVVAELYRNAGSDPYAFAAELVNLLSAESSQTIQRYMQKCIELFREDGLL